jgi:hypothetical protein
MESHAMSARTIDRAAVVFVALVLGFVLFFIGRHIARTIECDQSHCDHGSPEMVRGMWFHECMCIEKPRRP